MIILFEHFHDALCIVLILAPGCEFFWLCSFLYGMKLNKGHFPSGTPIIHFLEKFYQEINFKSHLNYVLLCK